MPIGDIVGEAIGGLIRFILQMIGELVLEIIIKGPGYLIARLFKANTDPDGFIVIMIGILCWTVIGGCSFVIYKLYFV